MRVNPNNETEREIQDVVIGTCLRFSAKFEAYQQIMNEGLFSYKPYKYIYLALVDLCRTNDTIDLMMVWRRLETHYKGHEVEGQWKLYELHEQGSPGGHMSSYIEELQTLAQWRVLNHAAVTVQLMVEKKEDPMVVSDVFQKAIIEGFRFKKGGFRPLNEGLKDAIDEIEAMQSQGKWGGVPSGIKGLDDLTGGYQKNDLIILGGRPGMGKTAFLLQSIDHAAGLGYHVALMSIEMPERDISHRMIGRKDPRLTQRNLRMGNIGPDGWAALADVLSTLDGLPISVYDQPGINMSELTRAVRSLHIRKPIELLVIDYLQLVKSVAKHGSREREVTEISNGLKELAKELHIPVLVAASLSRSCEGRPDKRPIMSDLRESGNIESDADVVFFVYRDEVADPETDAVGIAELLVRKNRNGPLGEVLTPFDGPTMMFGVKGGNNDKR